MEVFVSIFPLLIFTILLVTGKVKLLFSSIITFALVLIFSIFFWHNPVTPIINAGFKGIQIAFDIFLIIAGALFFLEVLNLKNILPRLGDYLKTISQDYRVQVILLVWFLENFIEGTAGFGTPTIVVAPILMSLGFSPLYSVALTLLGNSTSVVFGAAGTPIRVGFAGLQINNVPYFAALFNLSGILVPVAILWLATKAKNDSKSFISGLPMAIFAGLCFTVPSILILPLGQELPSILGSIIGLIIFIFLLRLKPQKPLGEIFAPYLTLISLLIITKFIFGNINPGFIFMISALPFLLFWKNGSQIFNLSLTAIKKAFSPFAVMVFMAATTQIMGLGSNSPLLVISDLLKNSFLPLLTPLLGAFGAFLTGSATVSNVMFGKVIDTAAAHLKFDPQIILGSLVVGASIGNMVALADMLAAQTVAGLKNMELAIIKLVILPCLVILTVVGVATFLVARPVQESRAITPAATVQIPTLSPTPIYANPPPFVAQAPNAQWKNPRFQDGCEEASALIANYWSQNVASVSAKQYEKEILDMSIWQEKNYGDYRDTSAYDTSKRLISEYFHYSKYEIKIVKSSQELIDILKNNRIIIAPTNGRALKNPHFTPPGPERHMLVIYDFDDSSQEFITQDPGISQGENYRYPKEILFNAIRDYSTGYHVPITKTEKNIIEIFR